MSTKHETQSPQDFSVLEDSYRIVGELSARDHVRGYLANRIADGADVLVLVEESPAGDTGNALTHFAADSNLLATLEHRNLIPIHEGRWLSPTAFALVTDRCAAPTLATLVARGESWAYPRIATILHEVNGLLEWARKQKVVHRTLTLDTIHIEPDTDRVLVSFVAQPLTRQGPPGAEGDSRTIASLAWTLITRGRDLPASAEDSLGIVRPELPRRLVEATDALLHGQRVGETDPPAPLDYIAMVAMADPLREGEVDAAELQAVLLQEQVLEREDWARKEAEYNARMDEMERSTNAAREEMERTLVAEREQLERTLLTEREELTETLASERRVLADERAEMERVVAEERRQMADERAALERAVADERAAMEETLRVEREQLAETLRAEREQLEQTLLAEREELTTTLADERRQLAAERAAAESDVAAEMTKLEGHRADLEAQLAAEREALAMSRSDAERELAAARAEFEAATLSQRQEFERLLAEEREEFDRTIMAERNALEAEKEGLAVFHSAERAQIDSERRALEELYLAYQAEGTIPAEDDDEPDVGVVGRETAERDRPARGIPRLLAQMAPMAFAQPITEPEPRAGEPAETETGQTRRTARRSMRAALMAPAAVLVLVALLLAAAFGIGNREARDPVDARVEQDLRRAAQPTEGVSPAGRGFVIDSAGGTVSPGTAPAPGARTP